MKKKIAGVLTTVLAASLLVGGNHPVTVQVDNMISGTQDDEDTQSDGAEVEAEEEQSEETVRRSQSSSGSGGPAGSYRDTEGRKKGRKRNTEKGSSREQL
ncbi:MAG: hypothetical protein ACLRH0_10385 [Blautia wexlerae]